jgi:23S rRNA (cytosine1962-C5)-methyltransferase
MVNEEDSMNSQNTQKCSAVWRIRRGMDRRFRSGHPWVYSNEIQDGMKGVLPGALIELQDAGGKFLARGYGNPHSLIAFRALSRLPEVLDPLGEEFLFQTLSQAGHLRKSLGLQDLSHRLCYGEGDGLPGFILDRFVLAANSLQQVFVIQAHTAGADRILEKMERVLKRYVEDVQHAWNPSYRWDQTAILIRNDLAVRKMESLEEQAPQVIKALEGVDLNQVQIVVPAVSQSLPSLSFHVDLVQGQKTGFFLDQFNNIRIAFQDLHSSVIQQVESRKQKTIQIVDLCCYVGQWGAQLAAAFRELGYSVEVTLVDASQRALDLAQKNVKAQGAQVRVLKGDVLKDLESLPSQGFDMVISDPPAFIKSRKDIAVGTHAYLQLNTQAFRVVKNQGSVVCCSCSALLEEESFLQVFAKASRRNQVQIQWVGRGFQSPDHPARAEFPEGRYLKSWMGVCQTTDMRKDG